MSPQEYRAIMTAYKQRASEDGKITREAFMDSVSSTNHPELAGKIFDVFDRDGSGTMDVCTFFFHHGTRQKHSRRWMCCS